MADFIENFFLLSLAIYFIPFIISMFTGNRIMSVFFINLILGWTFIGWLWALIWAFTPERNTQQIIIHNNVSNDKTIDPVTKQPTKDNSQNATTSNQQQAHNQPQLDNLKMHQDKINQLQQLKQLLDNNILNEEEFNQQKSKILAS